MKLGHLHRIVNRNDQFGEAPEYHAVLCRHDGRWEALLLTDAELKRVTLRAMENPEDWPLPTLLDRIYGWLDDMLGALRRRVTR
jgi:hypothetical protein